MDVKSNWDDYWEVELRNNYWEEPDQSLIDLKNELDNSKFKNVLDLGCGIGRHSILYAESGFNVTAVDNSQRALNILRQKCAEKDIQVKTLEGSYTEELLPENTFDLVIAYNVIYHGHRNDFKKAVSLIYKYLKPGGILFFTCPTPSDAKYGNGEEVSPNTYKSLNSVHPGDIHYFASEEDIIDFLNEFSGFKQEVKEYTWDNQGTDQFSSNRYIIAYK